MRARMNVKCFLLCYARSRNDGGGCMAGCNNGKVEALVVSHTNLRADFHHAASGDVKIFAGIGGIM